MLGKNAILVFLKHPKPGRVKTRLAATTSPEKAAQIYRRLVREVFARLPEGPEVIVMFDPPEERDAVAGWILEMRPSLAPRLQFVAQQGPGLGERLTHAFARAFAAGFEKVAAIGTDCIDMTSQHFDAVWHGLENHDCVLGPANDGGYYLIGLKAMHAAVFEGIAWSTATVYQQTLHQLAGAGLSLHELPVLSDIDDEKDWQASRLNRP